MDPRERSKIYNGASNGFSRAVEMVVTPLIFGLLGHRVDAWAGTTPLFTVALAVIALGYLTWKTCAGYQADMERHEAELRASRLPSPSTPPLVTHE